MVVINETFKVQSPYTCDYVNEFKDVFEHDPTWRKIVVGCYVLQLLQDMFKFNVSYLEDEQNVTVVGKDLNQSPLLNSSVDIYVKPMELRVEHLDSICPIQCIFMWRFGFIIRRRYNGYLQLFYSIPFADSVWFCIYALIIIGSLEFYLLSYWDFIQFGGECSFVHELLLAFSAYCQHMLPFQAVSNSRRIAYLSLIMCAYVLHAFYTSNLLSQLVMGTDTAVSLESLARSDYELATYKDMNLMTDKEKYEMVLDKNLSIVWTKLQTLKVLSISSALTAMMEAKTAVLTDYITLYPIIKRKFEINDICQLTEIDLYSNVKNYLFTSKSFRYKESFKLGTLRAKEAGLIHRQLELDKRTPFKCKSTVNHYKTQWEHTTALLTLVVAAYMLAVLVMMVERIHYQQNRVWPYIE